LAGREGSVRSLILIPFRFYGNEAQDSGREEGLGGPSNLRRSGLFLCAMSTPGIKDGMGRVNEFCGEDSDQTGQEIKQSTPLRPFHFDEGLATRYLCPPSPPQRPIVDLLTVVHGPRPLCFDSLPPCQPFFRDEKRSISREQDPLLLKGFC